MMHYKLFSRPQRLRGRFYLYICVFAVSLSLYLCWGACRTGRETDASQQPNFGDLLAAGCVESTGGRPSFRGLFLKFVGLCDRNVADGSLGRRRRNIGGWWMNSFLL